MFLYLQVSEPVFYNQSGAPCSRAETGYPDEDANDDEAYVLNEEEEAAFLSWVEEQDQLTEGQGILINDTGYDSYHLYVFSYAFSLLCFLRCMYVFIYFLICI